MPEVSTSRATCDRQIRGFGRKGDLRRPGQDARSVWVHIFEYTPFEKATGSFNPTDRRCTISVIGRDGNASSGELIDPPTVEDTIVVYKPFPDDDQVDETLRTYAPIGRIELQGEVIIWDLRVRKA